MLQILVAVCAAAALLIRVLPGEIEWLRVCGFLGVSFFVVGIILFRINSGIRGNGMVLRKIGKSIGDKWIPDV